MLTSGTVCGGIGLDTSEQPSMVAAASHLLVLSGPMLFTIGFESRERLAAPHHMDGPHHPTNKACLSLVLGDVKTKLKATKLNH